MKYAVSCAYVSSDNMFIFLPLFFYISSVLLLFISFFSFFFLCYYNSKYQLVAFSIFSIHTHVCHSIPFRCLCVCSGWNENPLKLNAWLRVFIFHYYYSLFQSSFRRNLFLFLFRLRFHKVFIPVLSWAEYDKKWEKLKIMIDFFFLTTLRKRNFIWKNQKSIYLVNLWLNWTKRMLRWMDLKLLSAISNRQ